MAGKIFLNYRRSDADAWADRLFERLIKQFPRDDIFMDIDGRIPYGFPWAKWLDQQVAACDLMLVLIGRTWVAEFKTRSEPNERDYVRVEIESALARNIPVVPVFLADTQVPQSEQLPETVRPLLALQAARLQRGPDFERDADALVTGVARSIRLARGEDGERSRPEGRIKIEAMSVYGASDGWFTPGAGDTEWFKDYEHGPEMVVVPPGTFVMGSPEKEAERESWQKGTEGPQHEVTIALAFAVSRHAITRGQFAAFVNNTNYKTDGGAHVWAGKAWKLDPKASWRNPGFKQDDSHPAVCVNWDDANAYAAWLSDQSRKTYRLPTEAEWEYVARAGTMTPFWWGSSITPKQANYDGNYTYAGGGTKGEYRMATVPVQSFDSNPWGLFNVHGNVREWCEDTWHDNYNGVPADGMAWLQGGDPKLRVVRGGSWFNFPQDLRSALRLRRIAGDRNNAQGFRLARTLGP
jgi:formylglycine-generating enzyme required for sulfatase activity